VPNLNIGADNAVVVTGLGVVSAVGADRESFWRGLTEGVSAIRRLELFDPTAYRTDIAAWIDDAGLDLSFLTPRQRRTTSRADRFGLLAGREALADAGLDLATVDPTRVAVVLGSGACGLLEAEGWLRQVMVDGEYGRKREILSHGPDFATDHLASYFGVAGIRLTVVTACSSATVAIGKAADLVRAGLADIALTGGSDSLARLTYGGFNSLRVVDPNPCRPFDRERNGMSVGEGAGILVLERAGAARRRGAPIYCRVAGYGVTSDAYHMTAPEPTGEAAGRAMASALRHARLDPSEIDHINAHGTATTHNDSAEALGIHRVFGDRARRIPTSSIKSMIGHCLCSAGALEAVAACLTIERGVIPPTLRWENPDPECALDVVPNTAREMTVRTVLSNSFAFGGNSASLALQGL
jgi:3-oxoacyl-[acyl-carrier-protein] synthase II